MPERQWGPRRQERCRRVLKRLVERTGVERGELLVPLRTGEELTLSNCIDVRVVRGCVEIWGALLRPSPDYVPIVAPPWAALPRLRARAAPEDSGPEPLGEEDPEVRAFLAERNWPTVLCLRAAGAPSTATELRQLLEVPLEKPRLQAHSAWPTLVEKFSEACKGLAPEEPPVLLVMGNKGVGKSCCCRYFVNALLDGASEVCYLETDLGQPELGPPGLVSLHRVRRPLLQAAHAAQHRHECSARYFAGGVTPGVEPALYVRCVRAAFQAHLQLRSGDTPLPPLVVNTHGWSQGLGLEFTRAILSIVRPQLIVRIGADLETPREVLNYREEHDSAQPPAKRRRTRLARYGPLAVSLGEAAGGSLDERAPSVLVDVRSQVIKRAGQTRGPPPSENRWLRFTSYFRPDLDPCTRPAGMRARELFGSLPRGRLPLTKLRFGLVHMSLPASEIEAAFTGTIAALCSLGSAATRDVVAEAQGPGSEEERLPRLLWTRPGDSQAALAPRCIAVAYIHSFDVDTREVTFFSPASKAELQEVDAILRGDIIWDPHAVRGVELPSGPRGTAFVSPLTPYCCTWSLDGLSSGTRAAKTKHMAHRSLLRIKSVLQRRKAAAAAA